MERELPERTSFFESAGIISRTEPVIVETPFGCARIVAESPVAAVSGHP